ncbi:MAG: hypothetical protein GY720_13645 [bacterium]|nr:hypothetical protein [bacterium]
MEAPQGRGGITPLPPPEPDGIGRELRRAPRPWPAALLALGGLVAFALWLAGSATDPGSDVAATGATSATLAPLDERGLTSTTPPPPPSTVPPPRLSEALPWLRGSLVMFSQTNEGDSMFLWIDSNRSPQEYRLSATNTVDVRPEPESLNNLAYETRGSVRSLYLGGWQTQEPVFIGSQGFAWDPFGSATLAWVGTDQITGTTALYMKGLGDPITRVADVPATSFLLEWTFEGLVMAESIGPPVVILDSETGAVHTTAPTLTVLRDIDGATIGTAAAEPLKVSVNGTIVARGTAPAFAAAGLEPAADLIPPNELIILDTSAATSDGPFTVRQIPIREALADGESIFSADGRWSLSPTGDWAGRVVNWATSTSLVVQSLETLSVRVVPIRTDFPLVTVGFSADGQRFFAYSSDAGELVAVDWPTGAQFTLPLDGNIKLGGAYIRQ